MSITNDPELRRRCRAYHERRVARIDRDQDANGWVSDEDRAFRRASLAVIAEMDAKDAAEAALRPVGGSRRHLRRTAA